MKKIATLMIIAIALIGIGCKKSTTNTNVDPRIPPKLDFKTGAIYVSKDTTLNKQDTILVGCIVTKTEDNLTSFNASVSFDGATTTSTFFNHYLSSNEYGGYSVDVTYYVRNQTGSEKLTFTIVDRDGNITKKTITLTII